MGKTFSSDLKESRFLKEEINVTEPKKKFSKSRLVKGAGVGGPLVKVSDGLA